MCDHLISFKENGGSKTFEIVLRNFVYPTKLRDLRRKAQYAHCFACRRSSSKARMHACLHCIYLGCFKHKHIHEHCRTKKHPLAVEMMHSCVYCFKCASYVYDTELEKLARRVHMEQYAGFKLLTPCSIVTDWTPCEDEVQCVKDSDKHCQLSPNTFFGLRGLVNMGNTCFMNCILQALTHTPVLRDFFMSDLHDCSVPSSSEPSSPANCLSVNAETAITSSVHPDQCLMCEFSRIFQQFYSGHRDPYVPYRLLHLIWTSSKHLAGYEQQDAHEFFISALDVLHRHCKTESDFGTIFRQAWPALCNCVIDQVFTGGLQSDVTCKQCMGVSTTVDPFWDISLHIGSEARDSCVKKEPSRVDFIECDTPPTSLTECLQIYTRQENLGSGAKIRCNSCNMNQESTKRLSFKKLPLVFCFHLKRFEQTSKVRKKISDYISFPYELDLQPFMSGSDEDIGPEHTRYVLYAVVNHNGTIDSGHYTSFIRLQKERWFHCDDSIITHSSLQDCLKSEAYLLFYHKKYLIFE